MPTLVARTKKGNANLERRGEIFTNLSLVFSIFKGFLKIVVNYLHIKNITKIENSPNYIEFRYTMQKNKSF